MAMASNLTHSTRSAMQRSVCRQTSPEKSRQTLPQLTFWVKVRGVTRAMVFEASLVLNSEWLAEDDLFLARLSGPC
jgi:hypothetical protein